MGAESNKKAYDIRVNKGVLPTINIEGHLFFVDIRMNKLRPKDDFLSNGISFSEIEEYFNDATGNYIFPYDPQKKELGNIDFETISEIPKNLIVVEIPSELKMDPIGWNRQHGYDLKNGLGEIRLEMNFIAKTCKWEDIYVPQKIKANLSQIERFKIDIQQKKSIKSPTKPKSKKGRRR